MTTKYSNYKKTTIFPLYNTEKEIISYLEGIKNLSNELHEFSINVITKTQNFEYNSEYTFDYFSTHDSYANFNGYEIQLIKNNSLQYRGILSVHSQSKNNDKIELFYQSEGILNAFNKFLIDKNSNFRFVEIKIKEELYYFVLPINWIEIYSKTYHFTSNNYIGIQSKQSISSLFKLIQECQFIKNNIEKSTWYYWDLQPYSIVNFELISLIPNSIIFADLALYMDNAEHALYEYIKDLCKISNLKIQEYSINSNNYSVSIRVNDNWHLFDEVDSSLETEFKIINKINSILKNSNTLGQIYLIEDLLYPVPTAMKSYMFLSQKDLKIINDSKILYAHCILQQ